MAHGRYVFVHTFGCQMNVYDTERMYEALRTVDYEPTDDPARADLILLNTCSVREKAEDKAMSILGRYAMLRESNPDLLLGVGGCMATREREGLFARSKAIDLVFGPDNIADLPGLVRSASTRRDSKPSSVKMMPRSRYSFPKAEAPRDGRVTAMVTVMKGCNKFCSFCIVPYTRGREVSKPPDEVVDEVRRLVAGGVPEVILLGQNVNSYGHDLEPRTSFADVLALVNEVDGLERIRFTTSHPWDATEELARAFRDLDKVCPYLHLPLQSGSDRILKMMRRGHTVEAYEAQLARLRELCPSIALSTDIIVGFPGERVEDFEGTLAALERIRYDHIFSFKYSPRPGTAAARLTDDVPTAVKKTRLAEVMRVQAEITRERLAAYVGSVEEVLVEGPSGRNGAPGFFQLGARTATNVVVNVDVPTTRNPLSLIGRVVPARITSARVHTLAAELA